MQEIFKQDNEAFLHIKKWQQINPQLIAGFTTRNGGVSEKPFDSFNHGLHVSDQKSAVIKNKEILAGHISFPIEDWTSAEQTHGNKIKVVDRNDKGSGVLDYATSISDVDGLITNQAGLLCTAFFADCVPLFFFDPITKYIGIAHAGWKGTVNDIQKNMVEKLHQLGVDKKDLLVTIGPSISKQNYEVNHHVIGHIERSDREKVASKIENDNYLLDLKQLNLEKLLQSGLLNHNITTTNYCTFEDEALFFSHRRDHGQTGRMLGYIGYRQ